MDHIILAILNFLFLYIVYVILKKQRNDGYYGSLFVGLYVVIGISGLLLYYNFTHK